MAIKIVRDGTCEQDRSYAQIVYNEIFCYFLINSLPIEKQGKFCHLINFGLDDQNNFFLIFPILNKINPCIKNKEKTLQIL